MIVLKDQIKNTIETNKYIMPHRYSFISLEEFCDLNNLNENDLNDDQINYFYEHYGKPIGLPACRYGVNNDHNDWIIENLQSHDYSIVIKRLQKLLDKNILDINTKLSEKFTGARIIKISLDKNCDIFNKNSQETFTLNNSDLSNKIISVLKFHNYYITLIYFYDKENVIILEPKQTENATEFVKKQKYVYHITSKENIQNILKKGLRPKVKKNDDEYRYRYYTERVFLIVDSKNIKSDIIQVINDLNNWKNYAILKIDISKLNITYWWDDASRGNTVYTVESVHPKFIEIIDDIENI